MYRFAITDPFNINWKYAVPKDFDTLEVFLKPGLSIVLSEISNGPKRFAIGAYLAGGPDRKRFNSEILPGRSMERVEKAFKDDNVSAFFGAKEAKELQELFESEKFICRKVEINSTEYANNLFGLPRDEYALVLDFFTETGVQQVADIKASRELFEDLKETANKEAKEEYRRERKAGMTGATKTQRKKNRREGWIGGGFIFVAAVSRMIGKALSEHGFFGKLAGIGLSLVATACSLTGVRLMANVAENYSEGLL